MVQGTYCLWLFPAFCPDVIAKIQLLVLLTKANAPLYMYTQILKWVTSSMDAGTNFRSSKFIGKAATLEGLQDVLNKRYCFEGKCFPTSQAVTLPKAQVKFNVIYFNFLEQMYSLLMDNILMQSDNLLFHNDNPFSSPPKQDPPILHDINDGSLYRNAYHKYVKNPSLNLLCGLIFFIDGTHLSINGRQILEHVTMTLSIFKKEVQWHPHAWRTLGFINKLGNVKYKKRKDHSTTSDCFFPLTTTLFSILFLPLFGKRNPPVEPMVSGQNHSCLFEDPCIPCHL
jgi:hypothetical protein